MEIIDHINSYLPKHDYTASKLKRFINQNIDLERLNLFYTEDDIKKYKPWIIHGLMTHLTYRIHDNFIDQFKLFQKMGGTREESLKIREYLIINGRLPQRRTLCYYYYRIRELAHQEFKFMNREMINRIYSFGLVENVLKNGWFSRLENFVEINVEDVQYYIMYCHQFIIDVSENKKVIQRTKANLRKISY
jgi:hypothetical protein